MFGYTYSRVPATSGQPLNPHQSLADWMPKRIHRTPQWLFRYVGPLRSTTELPLRQQWKGISNRFQAFRNVHFSGRPFSLRLALVVVGGVYTMNIIFMLFALIFSKMKGHALGTLISGDCHAVTSADTWLHLLINILSTLILFGSSVFMQLLSSPTRRDIDRAHARRQQLDIGVTSLRNLCGISKRRAILWAILGLSALPVHLFYNAVVSTVIGVPYYVHAAVTQDFLTGAPYYPNVTDEGIDVPKFPSIADQVIQDMQQNASRHWTRLEPSSCFKTYSDDLLTDHAHVVAVTSIANSTSSILRCGDAYLSIGDYAYPSAWTCGPGLSRLPGSSPPSLCHTKSLPTDVTWTVAGYPVQYCFSLPVTEKCDLEFSVPMMAAVLACNGIKLSVILYVTIYMTSFTSEALSTTGDALQSFLLRNDVYTKDLCLAGDRDFPELWSNLGKALPLIASRKRWYKSASGYLWATVIISLLCAVSVTIWLCWLGSAQGLSPLQSGFGSFVPQNIVFRKGIPTSAAAIVANTPQIVSAFVYLFYTGLLRCMVAGEQWSQFETKARPLRRTYLFGIPMRYGVPFHILSIFLHWFMSQGLFLARAKVTDAGTPGLFNTPLFNTPDLIDTQISTCGFSVMPGIAVALSGGLLLFAAIGLGMRQYASVIPLVVTSSAAISASAHNEFDQPSDTTKPMRWGLTWIRADKTGHCNVSSNEVKLPLPGPWCY